MHAHEVNIQQEKWNAAVEDALFITLDAIAETQEEWTKAHAAFYAPETMNETLDQQLDHGLNAICKDGEQYQRAWRIFHDNLPEEEQHSSVFVEKVKSIPNLFRRKK